MRQMFTRVTHSDACGARIACHHRSRGPVAADRGLQPWAN